MPIYTIKAPSGHELDIQAETEADALAGAENWYKQNVTDKTDTSMTGALTKGASDLASGVGKTIKEYISPDAGKTVQDAATKIADPKYNSATEGFSHPEDGADKHVLGRDWSKLPRAMVEQAPGLATDVLSQLALKRLGPLAQIAGGMASFGLRTAGNEAQKRATTRTGDENAVPTTEDKVVGGGSTFAQAALNQVGLSKITNPAKVAATGLSGVAQAGGNVAKAALAEGATNAAQGAISDVAAGGKVDTHSALDNFVLGGAGGGMFAGARGAKDAASAVRFRDVGGDLASASAAVANRLLEKAGEPEALQNPSTAFKATSDTHADVMRELTQEVRKLTSRPANADNALARASQGRDLNSSDLSAIEALDGAESVKALAKQATVLSRLKATGNYDTGSEQFSGGIAEAARKLVTQRPLLTGGAYAGSNALAVGFDGLTNALTSHALPVGAAYLGTRGIERALGITAPARAFAEKFGDGSGSVRPDVPLNQSPTGPKVVPQNSLTTPQPWGPVSPPPQRFKPDIIEPGIAKIVEKIRNEKRRDNVQAAMPLLRRLAALVTENGGVDYLGAPGFSKRVKDLAGTAETVRKLRRVPEEDSTDAPTAPAAPDGPNATPELFTLPESPYWHLDPTEASHKILADALSGPKDVRHPERYRASTERRLQGEETIYNNISSALTSVKERGDFHKYLSALWGSDSPEVVAKVRDQMLTEFPQHAATITKHLNDEAIKGLWKAPKKKK